MNILRSENRVPRGFPRRFRSVPILEAITIFITERPFRVTRDCSRRERVAESPGKGGGNSAITASAGRLRGDKVRAAVTSDPSALERRKANFPMGKRK